jgi:hypothetical protein
MPEPIWTAVDKERDETIELARAIVETRAGNLELQPVERLASLLLAQDRIVTCARYFCTAECSGAPHCDVDGHDIECEIAAAERELRSAVAEYEPGGKR